MQAEKEWGLCAALAEGDLATSQAILREAKESNRCIVFIPDVVSGKYPYEYAVENDRPDLIDLLRQYKDDAAFHPSDASTAICWNNILYIAARDGKMKVVRNMLEKEPAQINPPCKFMKGQTPLVAAMNSGHMDICRLLVSKGAMVNYQDTDRFYVVPNERVYFVGGHVNDDNDDRYEYEKLPQGFASVAELDLDLRGLPYNSRADVETLCLYAPVAAFNILLENGYDIHNSTTSWKMFTSMLKGCFPRGPNYTKQVQTDLLCALVEGSYTDHPEKFRMLVAYECFRNECFEQFNLILDILVADNDTDILDYTFDSGRAVSSEGEHTLLYRLVSDEENDALPYIECLLQHGADPDPAALMLACYSGSIPILKCLIKYGARVNEQAENGKTALSLIVESISLYGGTLAKAPVVRFLLQAGADMMLVDYDGQSAYSFAKRENLLMIVKIFDKHAKTVSK